MITYRTLNVLEYFVEVFTVLSTQLARVDATSKKSPTLLVGATAAPAALLRLRKIRLHLTGAKDEKEQPDALALFKHEVDGFRGMLPVLGYDNHDVAQVKHVPCVCQRQEIVHVLFSRHGATMLAICSIRRYDAGDMYINGCPYNSFSCSL